MKEKNTINEVRSLMKRMEDTSNGYTGLLSEVTCKWRYVTGVDEFYDIVSSIKEGSFMTFAYVDDAKIEVPKKAVYNPETRRRSQAPDYKALGLSLNAGFDMVNVIKVAIYNFPWQTLSKMNKQYSEFANKRNALYDKYHLELNDPAYATRHIPYGKSGIRQYAGANPDIQGHTYTDINVFNIQPISVAYYFVDSIGNLTKVDESKLKFLPPSERSEIERLKEAGATQDEIAPLLNMDYRRFEHSKILFLSATPDSGIPTLFVNNKLSQELVAADKIKPASLLKIAKDRYKKFFKNANQNAELNFLKG